MIHLSAVGKTWGVKYDQVILAPFFDSFYHITPGICGNTGEKLLRKPIIRKVLLRPSCIGSIQIHRLDPLCPTPCGVDRERPGIGEKIQYRQTRTHFPYHLSGEHMVKEQACIDTLGKVDGKSQSVFRYLNHKGLFTLQFMLFLAYSLWSAMKHHMGSLDIQHARDNIAANSLCLVIQTIFTVIGDPSIGPIHINSNRKSFQVPIIHTHARRSTLYHQTTHF